MKTKNEIVEELAEQYHQKLIEYVGHPQALRETIAAALDIGQSPRYAAAVLGRLRTKKKAAAVRENGKKGGRPPLNQAL